MRNLILFIIDRIYRYREQNVREKVQEGTHLIIAMFNELNNDNLTKTERKEIITLI